MSRYILASAIQATDLTPVLGLFEVPTIGGPNDGNKTWVLWISINPGAPLGGSAMEYFFGDWNGTTFTPRDNAARILDFGKDYYAAQTFYEVGEANTTTAIGWASNWQYTNVVPTAPWRSATTVARELTLQYVQYNPFFGDYVLAQTPVSVEPIAAGELANVTGPTQENQSVDFGAWDGAFDIRATFLVPGNASVTANTTAELRVVAGDQVVKMGAVL